MIREGLGIGVVPEDIARNYLQSMGLVLLRLLDVWAERQFFVCVRAPRELGRAAHDLFDVLRGEGAALAD